MYEYSSKYTSLHEYSNMDSVREFVLVGKVFKITSYKEAIFFDAFLIRTEMFPKSTFS